jgi:GTP-binding protein Era
MSNKQRCGYVAIIGRPNVGKSTLLNHLIGQKISITSHKPQTTRHRLLGIKTENECQIIYVDTPGIHQHQPNAMNRYLNRAATSSLEGVDVIVWLVESLRWIQEDEFVLKTLREYSAPVILCVNKVDQVTDKNRLLPYLQEMASKYEFNDIFPISARKGQNLAELEQKISELLPTNIHLFPEDQITDRNERFLAAEIIREKLVKRLNAEIPYHLTVEIESFTPQQNVTHIGAIIWIERQNQKSIIIGAKGNVLKTVGEMARKDIETMLERKVFLELWVKVKQGWCDDERALQQLGYVE